MNAAPNPKAQPAAQPEPAHSGDAPPALASRRASIGLALLAGLLLRLWFIRFHPRVAGDSLVYGDLARNLLQHHIYGFSQTLNGAPTLPRPTLIRLPGYPLFLALCFRLFGMQHYPAVLFVQALVDLCTCLLLGGTAARLFPQRSHQAQLAALWLGALCPFTATYVAAPLTETLTLFCIALAFYALIRWQHRVQQRCFGINRWLFCLAFALASAILLRPEQGLLAAAIVPVVFWISLATWWSHRRTRAFGPALLLSGLTLLPLAPWAARNWHTFHRWQPLAPRFANDPGEPNPSGFQRWYRTWAIDFASTEQVYWNYDGDVVDPANLPNRAFDSAAQHAATRALLDEYNTNTTSTPALDSRFNALAQQRIQAHPLRYFVALPLARVLNMALRPRVELLPIPLQWWNFRGHLATAMLALTFTLLNLLYFILAGITLARRRLWRPSTIIVGAMLASIALRSALLLTIDNSEPRYTLEFFPILIVLAAATLAQQRA